MLHDTPVLPGRGNARGGRAGTGPNAVAYRDRPPLCPHCGVELLRRGRRDIWRCPRCAGVQLATGELERRLRVLAPDISDEVIRDVMTARRSRATLRRSGRRSGSAALTCPTCQRAMHPVAMGGVPVARCEFDDQIWLDPSELERIAEHTGARHQSQRSWLARLFSHLFAT
jgi:Zn-finger nucleic acid-binding protein